MTDGPPQAPKHGSQWHIDRTSTDTSTADKENIVPNKEMEIVDASLLTEAIVRLQQQQKAMTQILQGKFPIPTPVPLASTDDSGSLQQQQLQRQHLNVEISRVKQERIYHAARRNK